MSVMSPRLLNPTSDLFARNVKLTPGERVLLLHSSDPQLAGWLLAQVGADGVVTGLHRHFQALEKLRTVPGLIVSDSVYPVADKHGPVDTVLLNIPKGRSVLRGYLWTAAQVLEPGGRLFLAGPNARGAKSAISDAVTLFGAAPVLGYKSSRRIAFATRTNDALTLPDEWAAEAAWKPQMRAMRRPDGDLIVVTMPGVFSWEHLDEGTALLLNHLGAEPGMDVLDIGCGYGIIGMAAARQGARVTLVDDDLLAVRCALNSVLTNDLAERCTVLPSDVTSAVRDRQFDLVLSNPPFHKGVDVDTSITARIVQESREVLRPGGRLRMVANRFLPYHHIMREVFGAVHTVAETARYHVLESVRK